MKREIHSNHRLIITPAPRSYLNVTRTLLDDMAAQVRRHVDNVGTVKIEYDTRAECVFCSREWEVVTAEDLAERPEDYVGDVVGQPVCCEKAVAEFLWAQAQAGGA